MVRGVVERGLSKAAAARVATGSLGKDIDHSCDLFAGNALFDTTAINHR